MSVNYADGLSPYEHKGKCGMAEKFDPPDVVKKKIEELTTWIVNSKHFVVHTGAGISTSAGIPDFRGPKGVWTLEQKGLKPEVNVTFENAIPTLTHRALLALEAAGIVKYVVSQNIDGLHLRSGYPRNRLSELHGNMFVEECSKCLTQYICSNAVPTMGLKLTGNLCTQSKSRKRCRGKLRDTILDWEDNLPETDIDRAEKKSRMADLSLCLGTSLQIIPSGNFPLLAKKNQGKLAVVNLQPTKHDKKANMKINTFVDDVMTGICKLLQIKIPDFTKPMVLLKSIHSSQTEKELHVVVKDESLVCTSPYRVKECDRKICFGDLQTDVEENNGVNLDSCSEAQDKSNKSVIKETGVCNKDHVKSKFNDDTGNLLKHETDNKTNINIQEHQYDTSTENETNKIMDIESKPKVESVPGNDTAIDEKIVKPKTEICLVENANLLSFRQQEISAKENAEHEFVDDEVNEAQVNQTDSSCDSGLKAPEDTLVHSCADRANEQAAVDLTGKRTNDNMEEGKGENAKKQKYENS